jgi:hypothetical protein
MRPIFYSRFNQAPAIDGGIEFSLGDLLFRSLGATFHLRTTDEHHWGRFSPHQTIWFCPCQLSARPSPSKAIRPVRGLRRPSRNTSTNSGARKANCRTLRT